MGAPKGNKNAEKWTRREAEELMRKAYELALTGEYDFIGEITRDLNIARSTFEELAVKSEEAKHLKKLTKDACEANCFGNAKKGKIVPSLAIINLKSNHGWTDRTQTDITTGGQRIEFPAIDLSDVKASKENP